MWQGGGRTRVVPGGTVLDGFIRVKVRTASKVAPTSRVQFGLLKAKKDGTWEELPAPKAVKFAEDEDGAPAAWFDFDRLEEGSYRWRTRLDEETGASPWVEFRDEKSGADFVSEKGLTRAIGRAFMGPYLLAFEVVSVLLLAALVGAAYLARKEVKD